MTDLFHPTRSHTTSVRETSTLDSLARTPSSRRQFIKGVIASGTVASYSAALRTAPPQP